MKSLEVETAEADSIWTQALCFLPSTIYPWLIFLPAIVGDRCSTRTFGLPESTPPWTWPLYLVDALIIVHFVILIEIQRISRAAIVTKVLSAWMQIFAGLFLWWCARRALSDPRSMTL